MSKTYSLIPDWREVLNRITLCSGGGDATSDAQLCVMQAIELITNPSTSCREVLSCVDIYPAHCVHPLIRDTLIRCNDHLSDTARDRLKDIIPSVIGTADIPGMLIDNLFGFLVSPVACPGRGPVSTVDLSFRNIQRLATAVRRLRKRYPMQPTILPTTSPLVRAWDGWVDLKEPVNEA